MKVSNYWGEIMRKIYYGFMFLVAVVFIRYQSLAKNGISDVLQAGAEAVAEDTFIGAIKETPEESLDEYNRKTYARINPEGLNTFLNKEIKALGLQAKDFSYFVGDDWQLDPQSGGKYRLVIPNNLPSDLEMITGGTEPEHKLNIVDLDRRIKTGFKDKNMYNQYRLAIRKALIEGVGKTFSSSNYLSDLAITAGVASAQKIVELLNANVGLALSALTTLYPYVAGQEEWTQLQKKIDEDVLKSNDIGLIEARIADLEDQLKDEKSSYLTQAYDYLPSAFKSGEKSALEQRIAKIKDYLEDNRFELEMLPKFLEKKK